MNKLLSGLILVFSVNGHCATSTSTASSVAINSAITASTVSAHNARMQSERAQHQQIVNQASRFKSRSIGVITCRAYYERHDDRGYVFEGCNVGGKYMSLDEFISRHAPGFEIDYFILNYKESRFEIYLRKKDEE